MNKFSFYVVSVGQNANGVTILDLLDGTEFTSELFAYRQMINAAVGSKIETVEEALKKFALVATRPGLTTKQVVIEIENINTGLRSLSKTKPECGCAFCQLAGRDIIEPAAGPNSTDAASRVKEDPIGDLLGSFLSIGAEMLIEALKDANKNAQRRDG